MFGDLFWDPFYLCLYAAEIFDVIESFRLSGHSYDDDSHAVIHQCFSFRITECCSSIGCMGGRSMDGVKHTEIER